MVVPAVTLSICVDLDKEKRWALVSSVLPLFSPLVWLRAIVLSTSINSRSNYRKTAFMGVSTDVGSSWTLFNVQISLIF